MNNNSIQADELAHVPRGILRIYKQAISNVPILKYSWVLIATICILALTAYFKLKNTDVFLYALGVILISFFGFLFSYLLKIDDSFIKLLLRILISSVVLTICISILGFGSFIIWEKPEFYNRWFPKEITIQKGVSGEQQLKSAIAELAGKKRTLAKLLELNADQGNFNFYNNSGRADTSWMQPLFKAKNDVLEALQNVSAVIKKIGLSLDYHVESAIYEELSYKSIMILNYSHFKYVYSPSDSVFLMRTAQRLKNDADTLDKLVQKNILKN